MLSKGNTLHTKRWFVPYAMLVSFGTYFCMYAFRKPFAAAQYSEATPFLGSIDLKIALIIAQVLGYALSKFIGIKVISEMKDKSRLQMLIGFILFSEIALIGFGLSKDNAWSVIFLFLNGLPLGMIWGIVFSYLEGRKSTEILGAGLCASFILSSGAVKSIGSWLMSSWHISEYWMPSATGLIFLPILLIFSILLNRLPAPSGADEQLRTKRAPMNSNERKRFFLELAPGLIALIICYLFVTAYRDFRDNFAAELWSSLGYGGIPKMFTLSELPIAFTILIILGLTMLIRNNRRAFLFYHVLILIGCLIIAGSTWLFEIDVMRGDIWMILIGTGLYLAYVPFNAILFDRLIAAFRHVANAGFLIYLADAFGYLGSISILLYKNFQFALISWMEFFLTLSYAVALIGFISTTFAFIYFYKKLKIQKHEKSLHHDASRLPVLDPTFISPKDEDRESFHHHT